MGRCDTAYAGVDGRVISPSLPSFSLDEDLKSTTRGTLAAFCGQSSKETASSTRPCLVSHAGKHTDRSSTMQSKKTSIQTRGSFKATYHNIPTLYFSGSLERRTGHNRQSTSRLKRKPHE